MKNQESIHQFKYTDNTGYDELTQRVSTEIHIQDFTIAGTTKCCGTGTCS
jgi:hypothetical protein